MEPTDTLAQNFGSAITKIVEALQPLPDKDTQEAALNSVSLLMGLKLTKSSKQNGNGVGADAARDKLDTGDAGGQGRKPDVREFGAQKNPKSDVERAALVAFFLKELADEKERKDTIAASDIEPLFIQANFPVPKHARMVLSNAKNAGYFDTKSAGQYRLNAVGYNLIAHNLPRTAGTTQPRRPRGPKRTIKKHTTKRKTSNK